MSARFYPSSDSQHNAKTYLDYYYPETLDFLYSGSYVKRKHQMKMCNRAVAYTFDNVRNDFFVNIYNNTKTILMFNTGLVKSLIRDHQYFALQESGLAKRRFKGLFIFEKNLLFSTHIDFRFRNYLIKLKALRQQYALVGSKRLARPLNKLLFFTLFIKLKRFSFKLPHFIYYRHWVSYVLWILHLGFFLFVSNSRGHLLSSYLQRRLLLHKLSPYRKSRRFANYYRKRLRIIASLNKQCYNRVLPKLKKKLSMRKLPFRDKKRVFIRAGNKRVKSNQKKKRRVSFYKTKKKATRLKKIAGYYPVERDYSLVRVRMSRIKRYKVPVRLYFKNKRIIHERNLKNVSNKKCKVIYRVRPIARSVKIRVRILFQQKRINVINKNIKKLTKKKNKKGFSTTKRRRDYRGWLHKRHKGSSLYRRDLHFLGVKRFAKVLARKRKRIQMNFRQFTKSL
jgi:hypothetical protein